MPERNKTAVILISRQNLRPSLKDEWVQNLKKAIAFVKKEGWTLGSSVGTPNWEIITAAAVIERVPLKIFVPVNCKQTVNELVNDFEMNESAVQFLSMDQDNNRLSDEELWKKRDRAILAAAEILIPVSIKPKGFMAESVSAAKSAGKKVYDEFQAEYDQAPAKIAYTIDEACLSDEIKNIGNEYVIHWTRSSNGPWPNEKKLDYYESVLSSIEYPHCALKTLQKIIYTMQIIASSKNMPDKISTVSFSALAPAETIKLMRWRPRYRQMSFEPYGIGVAKNAALSMGIKKVRYYDAKSGGVPNSVPSWLTQSGGRITDWRSEKEYRHKGDFDLSAVANENLIAIFYHLAEAKEFKKHLNFKSVSFCD